VLDGVLHAAEYVGLVGVDGGRLPFSWTGASLYASGASAVRARITRLGEDSVALALDDFDGRPVASVAALVLRPASAARIGGASAMESVYRLDWIPAPLSDVDVAADVVVVGDGHDDLVAVLGAGYRGDLDALLADDTHPDVVVVAVAGEAETPAGVRVATGRVLALLKSWLAADSLTGSRLVIVTTGAVGPEPDLCGAAVWGLVRSAQRENPGRFVLADVDRDAASLAALPAAVVSGEPAGWVRRWPGIW